MRKEDEEDEEGGRRMRKGDDEDGEDDEEDENEDESEGKRSEYSRVRACSFAARRRSRGGFSYSCLLSFLRV